VIVPNRTDGSSSAPPVSSGTSGLGSSASRIPSLSSSGSALFPIPSPSVSSHSVGSRGKASLESRYPSLSSSLSVLSPTPSLSVSRHSLSSKGNGSFPSVVPSPSVSGLSALVSPGSVTPLPLRSSIESGSPSWSVSTNGSIKVSLMKSSAKGVKSTLPNTPVPSPGPSPDGPSPSPQ